MSIGTPPHEHDEGLIYGEDRRLRRLAIQIATQLPENLGEATVVLRYTQELVDNFLTVKAGHPPGVNLRVVR